MILDFIQPVRFGLLSDENFASKYSITSVKPLLLVRSVKDNLVSTYWNAVFTPLELLYPVTPGFCSSFTNNIINIEIAAFTEVSKSSMTV